MVFVPEGEVREKSFGWNGKERGLERERMGHVKNRPISCS